MSGAALPVFGGGVSVSAVLPSLLESRDALCR